MKLINDGWLMISSGIILSSILGAIIIQERGIPINQPGFNGMLHDLTQRLVNVPFWGFCFHHFPVFVDDYIPIVG